MKGDVATATHSREAKRLLFHNRKVQLQHVLGASALVHGDANRFTFHGALPVMREYMHQWVQDHIPYHLPPGDEEDGVRPT